MIFTSLLYNDNIVELTNIVVPFYQGVVNIEHVQKPKITPISNYIHSFWLYCTFLIKRKEVIMIYIYIWTYLLIPWIFHGEHSVNYIHGIFWDLVNRLKKLNLHHVTPCFSPIRNLSGVLTNKHWEYPPSFGSKHCPPSPLQPHPKTAVLRKVEKL